jgi:ribonuclease BN (tRNA processing enzyme)
VCHGYAIFEDGELCYFNADTEPQKHHTIRIWQTPFVGPNFKLEKNNDSYPTDGARELCRDVDVLIHDSQYTAEEFEAKATWGHCTVEYAVWLAEECGVKTLVLYHHDPLHDDDQVDGFVAAARERGARSGLQVVGAREGATVHVGS